MLMIELLLSCVGVLLSIAFFTLVERKIMGLMHYRKGPNKVILSGVSQPISDAAKLLTKENVNYSHNKMSMYTMGPCVSLMVMLLCWGAYNHAYGGVSSTLKILLVISIMGLSAYALIFMSWGSNSKYALLGGYRSIAQLISYEVCLILFMLVLLYTAGSYHFTSLCLVQQNYWFGVSSLPLLLVWLLLCMAESNRTPFDLSEGESELVSGFNVEYGAGLFAFIFISEYGMILLLSFITTMLFLGASVILLKTMMISMVFIWVRCSFPRVRWDMLMMTAWKLILPFSVSALTLGLIL
uniref:NADH-ubiquinone oxidoreductase chain 1 n=1 Tax=Lepidoglyphus destructor TaxID=36936 RepID=A0A8F3ALV3_LEPDS|nr:NADH dehydrogenase subunit 1 [Lepidoglyphus destructor]